MLAAGRRGGRGYVREEKGAGDVLGWRWRGRGCVRVEEEGATEVSGWRRRGQEMCQGGGGGGRAFVRGSATFCLLLDLSDILLCPSSMFNINNSVN